MHPAAWLVWATCAGLVTFTTTDPFYLAMVVAASWFVYAAQRIPGETSRSFRMFAIAGVLTMVVRTALVFFGTVDAGSVAFAALEGARLATLLGRLRHLQRRDGPLRRRSTRAAALPRARARRRARAVDRPTNHLHGRPRPRGPALARVPDVPLANPAGPGPAGARDRHGRSRHAGRVHGRTRPRTGSPNPIPPCPMDDGRGGHDRVRVDLRGACSWQRRSAAEAGCTRRRSR